MIFHNKKIPKTKQSWGGQTTLRFPGRHLFFVKTRVGEVSFPVAGIRLHQGKTRLWNKAGVPPYAQFVAEKLRARVEEERRLWEAIPTMPDLQCEWHILHQSANPRCPNPPAQSVLHGQLWRTAPTAPEYTRTCSGPSCLRGCSCHCESLKCGVRVCSSRNAGPPPSVLHPKWQSEEERRSHWMGGGMQFP